MFVLPILFVFAFLVGLHSAFVCSRRRASRRWKSRRMTESPHPATPHCAAPTIPATHTEARCTARVAVPSFDFSRKPLRNNLPDQSCPERTEGQSASSAYLVESADFSHTRFPTALLFVSESLTPSGGSSEGSIIIRIMKFQGRIKKNLTVWPAGDPTRKPPRFNGSAKRTGRGCGG